MHSIRDQDEAIGVRIEGNLNCRGVKVNAVRDDAKVGPGQILGLAQHTKDTRVTMVQGSHGVKKMRDHGSAIANGLRSLLVRGFRVTDRVDDAARSNLRDQIHHLAALWSSSDHLDGHGLAVRLGLEVLGAIACFDIGKVLRLNQNVDVVDSILGRIQEWAFAVRAERLSAFPSVSLAARWSKERKGLLHGSTSC